MKLSMDMSMGTLLSLIGRKVRCIEEASVGFNKSLIKVGEIYTVHNAYRSLLGSPCIVIDGGNAYTVELFELVPGKLYNAGGNV